MEENNIKELKEVEFYAASVNAWYSSALERDKSLLTLSTGGIGLLLTLLITGVSSCLTLCLYIGAILSFLVAIVAVLKIFVGNCRYIEQVIAGKSQSDYPKLIKLDLTAFWAFGVGVLSTAVLCMVVAFNFYTQKEISMSNEPTKKPLIQRKSFTGAEGLYPPSTSNTSTQTQTNPPPTVAKTPAPATDSSQKK